MAYYTAPPAHSRRSAHFLKPLPIAALAALLAAPAAWAITGATETFLGSGEWHGDPPLFQVTIDSDATWVFGRFEGAANATGAIVTMTVGTVTHLVGGLASSHNATGNEVTISGGTVTRVEGGKGSSAATNKVFIEAGGTVTSEVIGGSALNAGNASGNEVHVRGDAGPQVVGGRSEKASAEGNKVFIEAGGKAVSVYGGQAFDPTTGNATGNTVTLAGGAVTGAVYGGSCAKPGCDMVSGNTLNVQAKMTVGGDVLNFDTLNFDLGTVGANDVVLDVGGTADFSKVTAAKFSFNLADGAALKPGDTITLIKAGSLKLPALPTSVTVCGHDFELSTTATALTATVKEPPTPDPTPGPTPYYHSGDNSSPSLGELGLLLSGIALAGAAAPALRRREKRSKKL